MIHYPFLRSLFGTRPILVIVTLFIAVLASWLLNRSSERSDARRSWAKTIEGSEYHRLLAMNGARDGGELEGEDEDRPDRPDLAWQQNALMTMDPATGQVPNERLTLAHAAVDQFFSLRAAIPGVTWEERGPNNVGGRTRAVMFDPNDPTKKKVWAGGVYGGLWYTNDITVTNPVWVHVNGFWDNIAISSIAYDPSNTNVLYVGTGEGFGNSDATRGGGIWKSTDGGTVWNLLAATAPGAYNSGSHFHYVNRIVVKANGYVFAATSGYFSNNGGVIRSIDGGVTWTRVLNAYVSGGSYAWACDIEVAANGDLFAAVGMGGGGRIYKATNASDGASGTWTDLSANVVVAAAKRIELACAPSNASVIYAVARGGSGNNDTEWFKKSIDGGTSWSSIAIPRLVDDGTTHFTRRQAWYDLILSVHPTDANLVLAGGVDLHRTTNGGTSWTGVSHWYGGFSKPNVHADQHAMAFRPGATNEWIFGNDGGVHYSTDVGNSGVVAPGFAPRNSGYNVTQFYACATRNQVNANYFLAGAQDNGSQRYDQPQMNSTVEVTGGDGGFCHIDQLNPNIQTTAYTNNTIYRSLDGGNTFPQLISESSGHFINPSDYDSQRKILYLAAGADQLKRISGFDATITNTNLSVALSGSMVSTVKVSPYNDVAFFGAEDGAVYKLTNASTATPTLTRIDNGTTPITTSGWVSSIDVGANDSEILVTYSNYGVVSVWETVNGGTTWRNKEGNLPDMPIRCAIYNPNDREQVLLGTEVGAWSTAAIGHGTASVPDWQPTNTNLAHTRVDQLRFRAADGLVVAATHGRGLYTTDVFVANSIADFSHSPTFTCSTSLTVAFKDGSLKAGGSWAWDVDNNGTVDYTTRNPTHTYAAPGAYSVKLTVNSGAASITRTAAVVVMGSAPVAYTGCMVAANSNGGNGFGIGIFRVALNEIDHSTSNNDGAYNDYTCTRMTKLQRNTTYTVTVRTGTANAEAAKVYIDYDNNGVFGAGEEVASFAAATTGTRSANFTTPSSGVTMDTPLRMRVLSKFSTAPTDPCNVSTYGQAEDYTVYFNSPQNVALSVKAWLAGPLVTTPTPLMYDSLRTRGDFPLGEPFTGMGFANAAGGGGETTTPGVLAVTGNNAIVDWVRVELRNASDPTAIVATRQCLIQRDGDVVSASDGTSSIVLNVVPGNYYVALRHRNHLGCMTAAALALSTSPTGIDFQAPATATFGTDARKTVGSLMALWQGNVVLDAPNASSLKYTGAFNDRDPVLLYIGGVVPTNTVAGYRLEDVNLDGLVKYTGSGNDRDPMLINIGGVVPTNVRVEQMP